MKKIKFFDENTRQWWMPNTGGSNIPALNNLFAPWNITFGSNVYEGTFYLGHHTTYYASGTSLVNFPSDGLVITRDLQDQGSEIVEAETKLVHDVAIMGLYQVKRTTPTSNRVSERDEDIDREKRSLVNKEKSKKRNIEIKDADVEDVNMKVKNNEDSKVKFDKETNDSLKSINSPQTTSIKETTNVNIDNSNGVFANQSVEEVTSNGFEDNGKKITILKDLKSHQETDKNNQNTEQKRHIFLSKLSNNGKENSNNIRGGNLNDNSAKSKAMRPGRLIAYGDSNCLDGNHMQIGC